MHKIKILSLGFSQSNFLTQLYSEIKLRSNKFTFHVDNFEDLSGGNLSYDQQVFESYHNFNRCQFSKLSQYQVLIGLLCKRIFWVFFWFEIKQGKGANHLLKFVKKEVKTKACVDKIIIPLNFDIYQFHFCVKKRLKLVHYLPKNSKIVCSYWGSDLYRNRDDYNAFYVKKALSKATYVTIQTPEMAIDLFKTQGDFLKKKVIYAQFAVETEIYKLIDLYRTDEKSLLEFRQSLNIPSSNTVLTIGYNATEAFNHIVILEKLNLLDSDVKDRITCVLPLTYSRKESYLDELYEYIDSIELNIVCLDTFLPHEDIAKLRLITNIQIQMPISDALSGSVTEVLYAGNVVLAGSWLPYGIYKRNGISIETVASIDDLGIEILQIIENLDKSKSMDTERRLKIENHFFPEATTEAWIDLYNRML